MSLFIITERQDFDNWFGTSGRIAHPWSLSQCGFVSRTNDLWFFSRGADCSIGSHTWPWKIVTSFMGLRFIRRGFLRASGGNKTLSNCENSHRQVMLAVVSYSVCCVLRFQGNKKGSFWEPWDISHLVDHSWFSSWWGFIVSPLGLWMRLVQGFGH